MGFLDILRLAVRNLREAKLRAGLTTMGVIVGVAMIVTMVSFGLGLQRNTVERFKTLDLFNEIQVYGRDLNRLVEVQLNRAAGAEPNAEGNKNTEAKKRDSDRNRRSSDRALTDVAIEEIAALPGVAYIEPTVRFTVYLRANERVQQSSVGGVRVPNSASRFQNFAAGKMIAANATDEAVVDEAFVSEHGFKGPAEAVGQRIEFLAPERAASKKEGTEERSAKGSAEIESEEPLTFFGLPLEETEEGNEPGRGGLTARTFRIVGVLKDEVERGAGGNRRFRGVMPAADIYIPLAEANSWRASHQGMMEQVALRLARQSGLLAAEETEGYQAATVRVHDPAAMKGVVESLRERGFNVFGLFTELDEIRTFFLIVNAALGLLGGISLLVASFGIANTMIMSILERTREIGIMKAIGAEDLEIKLIFFVEAAVIGLTGGVLGALAAWGIDGVANRLVYKFLLEPRGEPFINFFSLPPYLWLSAILFAMIVSVIAALYPAARAARIDPVKALRHD